MRRISLIGWLLVSLPLTAAVCLLMLAGACETGGGGPPYPLTDTAAQGISNVVTAVGVGASVALPAPFNRLVETLTMILLAALAAWQTWTHKTVVQLKNGKPPTKKDPQP